MKKFIDIGANLTDRMFKGFYGHSQKHSEDLPAVIDRAFSNGMERMIITGGSLSESKAALSLSRTDDRLYVTVGCHPTRCSEFLENPDSYYDQLKTLILDNKDKVVAVGECGLDYDREKFCPRNVQRRFFDRQCTLSQEVQLPLFLHCRAAHSDFIEVLESHRSSLEGLGGVVHTFDSSLDIGLQLIKMGYQLGLNGCSLKTQEQLDVVRELPIESLLLETDAPWCEIRPTHAGFKMIKTTFPSRKRERWEAGFLVKSRNEPVNIHQVLEVVAATKKLDENALAEAAFNNTMKLFFRES